MKKLFAMLLVFCLALSSLAAAELEPELDAPALTIEGTDAVDAITDDILDVLEISKDLPEISVDLPAMDTDVLPEETGDSAPAEQEMYYVGEYAGNADGDIPIDESHFPDADFRLIVKTQFDYDGDDVLSQEEIAYAKALYTSDFDGYNVASMKGIEYLTALTDLRYTGQNVTSLDVSKCKDLNNLTIFDSPLKKLNISGCTSLVTLYCRNNKLVSLDAENCTSLKYLYCDDNQLKSLKVKSDRLRTLSCTNNPLKSLDISGCPLLLKTIPGGWRNGEYFYYAGRHYGSNEYYYLICDEALEIITEKDRTSISAAEVTLPKSKYAYDGKEKKPSVTVKLNGKTLKKNTDYKVTYKNNTNIGTATVKVTGIGSYKGSASATFRIVPATPKLKAVSEEAGKAELSVGRVAGATGYEFRWKRTNASKENSMSTTSLTISISRLKAGAKYAFRARAYGEVSGERVYGSFCSAKTVTISKDAPKAIPVTSITLNHTQALLQKGGSLQLTATVKPNDATNKEVEWTSSNAGVASVDDSGKVTGKKAGKATVTAKAKDGSGVSASCEVNVGTASLTADTWNLGFGEPVQLKVNSPAKKAAVTYSVDDPAIARVNGKGVVTAGNKEGETTVRARITLGNTSLSAEHKLWVWGSNKNKGFTGMLLTEIKKEVNDKLLNAYDKFYSAMTGKMESTQTTLKNKVEASVAIQVAYGSMFNVTKKEQQAFKEAFSSQIDPDKLQASDYSKCKTSMDLVNAIAKLLMNGTKGEYVYYVNGKPYRMKITKIPSWGAAYVQGTVLFPNGKELVWGGTEVSTESIKDQLDYLRLYGKVKVSEAEKKVKETIKKKTVELLDIDWLTKAAKDCISGSTKKWVKENYYSLYQYAEGLGKVAKAYNDLKKALKGLKPADMTGKLTLDVVRTVAGYGKKVQTFTETVESLGDTLKI